MRIIFLRHNVELCFSRNDSFAHWESGFQMEVNEARLVGTEFAFLKIWYFTKFKNDIKSSSVSFRWRGGGIQGKGASCTNSLKLGSVLCVAFSYFGSS